MPVYSAEFEEKSFEAIFNREIQIIDAAFWAPGQVLEGKLGFDMAGFTGDVRLRSLSH